MHSVPVVSRRPGLEFYTALKVYSGGTAVRVEREPCFYLKSVFEAFGGFFPLAGLITFQGLVESFN